MTWKKACKVGRMRSPKYRQQLLILKQSWLILGRRVRTWERGCRDDKNTHTQIKSLLLRDTVMIWQILAISQLNLMSCLQTHFKKLQRWRMCLTGWIDSLTFLWMLMRHLGCCHVNDDNFLKIE